MGWNTWRSKCDILRAGREGVPLSLLAKYLGRIRDQSLRSKIEIWRCNSEFRLNIYVEFSRIIAVCPGEISAPVNKEARSSAGVLNVEGKIRVRLGFFISQRRKKKRDREKLTWAGLYPFKLNKNWVRIPSHIKLGCYIWDRNKYGMVIVWNNLISTAVISST